MEHKMRKILVINGSPKKESDTFLLTSAFISELKGDIEVINIIEKDIKPCTGCFRCMLSSEVKCFIDDYQNEILQKIINSDIIIYSFPLYFYSIPSHLKASWDRLLPLCNYSVFKVGDRYDHYTKLDLSKKKFVIISGAGLPDFSNNFKALEIICKNTFYTPLCIFVPKTPILHNDKAESITKPLLMKFKEAGREYNETLNLKQETIDELEKPMIDNETYMNIINSKENK